MKNNIFRKILLIGIVLLSTMSLKVNALVYVTKDNDGCTLTDEYKEWLKLSDKEKQDTVMPVRCKEMVKHMTKATNIVVGDLPSLPLRSYNLMNVDGNNYVTPVKSQTYADDTDSNMCWAFASNAVVETSYLLNGGSALDLSEKHISYSASRILEDNTTNSFGYNGHYNINGVDLTGGSYLMSGTYFAQRRGPVLESKLPFETISSTHANTVELKPDYYVKNILYFGAEGECGSSEVVSAMKQLILNYGALTSLMTGDPAYISDDGSSVYANDGSAGHGITIIGWNNNYSKENFATTESGTPPGDGAWIVKNTYPDIFTSDLGDGYHYTSYYDIHVCMSLMGVQGVTEGNDYNLYTYDKLGYNGGINSGDLSYDGDYVDTAYFKQVYTKKSNGNEVLESINLFGYPTDEYELYYSVEDDFDAAELIGEGTFDSYGYFTVDVENMVINSDTFYIYLKYVSNQHEEDYGYYFPSFVNSDNDEVFYYIENPSVGVSYYSLTEPTQWNDTAALSGAEFYPNMYVFTTNVTNVEYSLSAGTPVNGGTTVTPTQGYYYIPLSKSGITYNDISVGIFDENDTNVTSSFNVEQYADGYKITPISGVTIPGDYIVMFDAAGLSSQQEITIYSDPVLATSVTVNGYGEVTINGTLTLTATVLPESTTNKTVSWSSSNPEVASINSDGVVTGHQLGTVEITATTTDGSNKSGTKIISVIDDIILVTGVSIDGLDQVTEGHTIMLTATVTPANATNKVVSWSSSDESIATINSDGLLTAVAPGTVTITATTTDGSNKHAIKTITVKRNIVLVNSVQIRGLNEVSVNGTLNLSVEVGPSNATNKTVSWTSSNDRIATVDENGVVVGKKAGTVTISATATDGSNLKDSIIITVIDINKEEGQGTTKPIDSNNGTVDNPKTGDTLITLSVMLLGVVIVAVVYMKKKGIIKNI